MQAAFDSTSHESTTMNRNLRLLTITIVASAVGYSGSARADDITIDPTPFVPSASRAQVRAELDAFNKSGVSPWATHYDHPRNFKSSASRAQVTAEYIRERAAVASMTGEDSGSTYMTELRHQAHSPAHLATRRSNDAQQ
jgi:hypothetical protein